MNDIFIKKYWADEDKLFYLHFQDKAAVKQIEITANEKIFLDIDTPVQGESMLYDQELNLLDLEQEDFITKEEFNIVWQNK
ncbi:MAG: hypothetical protein U5L45_23915 [Saprospiraceae bacterium]|nr:hypothetical protein [Saprospiraceae bacterium]